ncbi:MAG: hypothetical protein M3450_12585 [Actinomycetota bacterium]|nr:hypothetical protein [Actinomycetota bacterium]
MSIIRHATGWVTFDLARALLRLSERALGPEVPLGHILADLNPALGRLDREDGRPV